MEEYLFLKYSDRRQARLIATQQSILEECEKQAREIEEWQQIEEILRIGRMEFRREVESERSDAVKEMRKKVGNGIQRRA